jgi:hypothetical protein
MLGTVHTYSEIFQPGLILLSCFGQRNSGSRLSFASKQHVVITLVGVGFALAERSSAGEEAGELTLERMG